MRFRKYEVMTTTTIEYIPKAPIMFTIGWAGDQTGKPICHRLYRGFVANNKTRGWATIVASTAYAV
jgi:hypothetical protein